MSFSQLNTGPQGSQLGKFMNNYNNKLKIVNEGKTNLGTPKIRIQVKKAIKDLETLGKQIGEKLTTDPEAPQYRQDFQSKKEMFDSQKGPILQQIQSFEEQEQQRQAAMSRSEMNQDLIPEEDKDAAEIEVIAHAATDIANDMADLKDSTHELKTMIDDQHKIVVQVDEVIIDAKEEMVEGNKELVIAENHQTSTTGILKWILAGAAILVILVIVAVIAFYAKK